VSSWIDGFPSRIQEIDAKHLRRTRRVIVPQDAAYVLVNGERMLNFCSNDYLDLARHPALSQAACKGALEFGVGSGRNAAGQRPQRRQCQTRARAGRLHRHAARVVLLLVDQLRRGIATLLDTTGWQLGNSATPIQPLVIGGNAQALRMMEALSALKLWVSAILPPTVPNGTARLRISLSAAHTKGDVHRLIATDR
jgi:7-keto-8-aminopelargonate synthetase-like enzyme